MKKLSKKPLTKEENKLVSKFKIKGTPTGKNRTSPNRKKR